MLNMIFSVTTYNKENSAHTFWCKQIPDGLDRTFSLIHLTAIVLVVLIVSWLLSGIAYAESEPIRFELGSEEIVFDWTTDRCEFLDIPDSPSRAFRDAENQIHLIATHHINRQKVGLDFDSLVHECNVIFQAHGDPDPAQFNDREWLSAVYTIDGATVHAVVHHEYHGQDHEGQCPSGIRGMCAYTSSSYGSSIDMGNSYTHLPAPDHRIANLPYRYIPDHEPFGMSSGTNIIKKDEYYYKFLTAKDHGEQQRGLILMRTQTLPDHRSWRCWDGEGFNVEFINPYFPETDGVPPTDFDPANHVCEPVSISESGIMGAAKSVSYNTYLQKYMLLSHTGYLLDEETLDEETGEPRRNYGFFYSLSSDLVNWGPSQVLLEIRSWNQPEFEVGTTKHGYPVLIDPNDTSRNFEGTEDQVYLYYTANHFGFLDRDLVRRSVTIIDEIPPTIEISDPSEGSVKSGDTVSYIVTYADPAKVTVDLTVEDIVLETREGDATGTVLEAKSQSSDNMTWIVTVGNFNGNGTLGMRIKEGTARDAPGNVAVATNLSATFEVDNTRPTVSLSDPSLSATNSGPVSYTVTYEGADEVTLESDLSRIVLDESGLQNSTSLVTKAVTGGGDTTRKIWLNNITGDGTLRLRLNHNTAQDAVGNTAPSTSWSASFIVDNTRPTVSLSGPSVSTVNAQGSVGYTVIYEGADEVNLGSDLDRIVLDESGLQNSTSLVTKTVTVIGSMTRQVTLNNLTGDGMLRMRLEHNTAWDAAGNTAPSTPWSPLFTVDNTAPEVSIGAPSVSETVSGPVSYTLNYSGADTVNLTPAQVSLDPTGSATGTIEVSNGSTFSPTVTISNISGMGTLGISIALGTASDLAGNLALGSSSVTFLVDDTDTDGDGEADLDDLDDDNDDLSDEYEGMYSCLDPLQSDDTGVDVDGDGLTILEEFNFSSQLNPCDPDTDGDRIDDGLDRDPLSSNNACVGSQAVFDILVVGEIQCGAEELIDVSPLVEETGSLHLISPNVKLNPGRVSGELSIHSTHPCVNCASP